MIMGKIVCFAERRIQMAAFPTTNGYTEPTALPADDVEVCVRIATWGR